MFSTVWFLFMSYGSVIWRQVFPTQKDLAGVWGVFDIYDKSSFVPVNYQKHNGYVTLQKR